MIKHQGESEILIQYADFNGAEAVINSNFNHEWDNISWILTEMPLHIKASVQAGRQGNPIFDPVGTNEYIKSAFIQLGWQSNIPIPQEYRFLGTDIDFGTNGVIIESQFSNYPFLLNNTLRSELFFKAGTRFAGYSTQLLVLITKALMFPAANSTLYYEQAVRQLTALTQYHVFDIPIRLIGLFEEQNVTVPVIWTVYSSRRYSRTIQVRNNRQCQIIRGRLASSRCLLRLID